MSTVTEPVRLYGLAWDVAGMSEQGPRPENQDALLLDAFGRTGVVAVADGMGGERGGRYAADTALATLAEQGPLRSFDEARRVVRLADAAVTEAAEQSPTERAGMGCALGVLALSTAAGEQPFWIGAHVGDVRILSRSPDGTVRLETRDHTPAFARWEAGEISLDEIPDTPGANRLQRAVGRGGEADVVAIPARAGWSYLIVSDGIYKAMRLDELGAAMGAPSAASGCEAIRLKVEERGPDDNFTALLVRALGGPPGPAEQTGSADTTLPNPMNAPAPPPPGPPGAPPPGPPAGTTPWAAVAALLALLALAAAGYAWWTARAAADTAAEAAARELRVDSLQQQLESLRQRVQGLEEPFGLANPAADTGAAGLAGGAARPATAAPTQP